MLQAENELQDITTPLEKRATQLYNGTYTITSPSGEHRTFRIKTVQGGNLAGKRIVEKMIGSDNENDYVGFGFVLTSEHQLQMGAETTLIDSIKIWSRFLPDSYEAKCAKLLEVMGKLGNDCNFGRQGFRIQLAKRCSKCNRKLTDPTSIDLGIGPICRAGGIDAAS